MGEKFHFQAKGMPLIKFQDADKIKSLQAGKFMRKLLDIIVKEKKKPVIVKLATSMKP